MTEIGNKPIHVGEMPVRTYSSDKSEYGIIQTYKNLWREFPAAHSLGFSFTERNIRARYRQSVLGIFWAFLPPLVTTIIWIILYNTKVVKINDPGVPYPLFVITGTLLWSIFSNAILMPMQTIQSNKTILVKLNFPREALLVNSFYEILFNVLIGSIIIVIAIIAFNVPVTFHSLLFFPSVLILMILGISLGLLLLPVSFLYKDIQFVMPSLLQFAMYLTPVVYAQPVYKGAAKILMLNPVSPVLTSARAWLLGLDTVFPLWQISAVAFVSVVLLLVGIFLQRITMQILIERMGS